MLRRQLLSSELETFQMTKSLDFSLATQQVLQGAYSFSSPLACSGSC